MGHCIAITFRSGDIHLSGNFEIGELVIVDEEEQEQKSSAVMIPPPGGGEPLWILNTTENT